MRPWLTCILQCLNVLRSGRLLGHHLHEPGPGILVQLEHCGEKRSGVAGPRCQPVGAPSQDSYLAAPAAGSWCRSARRVRTLRPLDVPRDCSVYPHSPATGRNWDATVGPRRDVTMVDGVAEGQSNVPGLSVARGTLSVVTSLLAVHWAQESPERTWSEGCKCRLGAGQKEGARIPEVGPVRRASLACHRIKAALATQHQVTPCCS